MTITLRGVKGSTLTQAELDGNFTDLDGRVSTAQTAATAAGTAASTAATAAATADTKATNAGTAAATAATAAATADTKATNAGTAAAAAQATANAAVKTVNGQSPDGAGNVEVAGGGGSASNLSLGTRTATTAPIANSGGTGVSIPVADSSLAGIMASADKVKLDALPTNATLTTALAGKQADLGLTNAAALNTLVDTRAGTVAAAGYIAQTQRAVASGVATLDTNVRVPAAQLPNTDAMTEGTTNLFATAARILGTVLTGLSTATNSAALATDTLLVAIGKLQAQVASRVSASAAVFTGVVTSAWANIVTPTAMAALAIDTTKLDNTKSVTTASTFTLSATPAAGTVFGLELTNGGSTPLVMTLPAGTFFSRLRQANITTFVLPASGRLNIFFKYDGTRYLIVGEPGPLNNYNAAVAPTTSDNVAAGYDLGSVWTTTAEATPASGVWLLSDTTPITWARLDTSGGGGVTVEDLLTSTSAVNALSANQGRLLDLSTKKSDINAQTTAYTGVITDAGKVVDITVGSAVNFTIPTNATVPYPVGTVIAVRQSGAGAVTIVGAGGVTLQKPTARTYTTSAQYEQAVLHQVALNTWMVHAS